MAAIRGAEPSVERSAAGRSISAYTFGVARQTSLEELARAQRRIAALERKIGQQSRARLFGLFLGRTTKAEIWPGQNGQKSMAVRPRLAGDHRLFARNHHCQHLRFI